MRSRSPSVSRTVRGALIASVFASRVIAAENGASLGEMVVTATRTQAPLSAIGDSISVISAPEAQFSQKLVLSDLLSSVAGVSVSRNGGMGATTAVRIRGADDSQTLVLIDGVKINDPASPGGAFNFATLLVDDIARVEVLRGSQSTLWGSQAIGGVINIVTPKPQGPLTVSFDTETGSYGTGSFIARAQSGNERYGWRVGARYLTTDGISAFDEDLGGREKDGFRNVGASANGFFRVSDAVQVEMRSTWWRSHIDFDGFPPPSFSFADTREHGTSEEWVSYAGLTIDPPSSRLHHRVGISYADIRREDFNPDSSVRLTYDSVGSTLRYEYQASLALNEQVSGVLGLERERSAIDLVAPSEFDPSPTPLRSDVTLDSAYAQVQVAPLRILTLSAGLRYDDHEIFGNHTSRQFALAWSATESTVLRASYGEGFKAPTLYQMYSPYGNLGLRPEESEDWDIGIEQRILDLNVSTTYFERDTRSLIDFVSCFGVATARCLQQPQGYYENLQRSKARGYELSIQAPITPSLSFDANYTRLEAVNRSPGSSNFGNDLPRRARDMVNARLTYRWPMALTTTLAAQYVGRRFDDAQNSIELGAYTLVDLRAAYRLSETLELYGRIENLFDEDYETAYRYGTIGRGVYLGVRVTL